MQRIGVLLFETREYLKYAIKEQSYFTLEHIRYSESFYNQSPIAAQTLESIANALTQKGNYLC